jgi:antitoxin VapB
MMSDQFRTRTFKSGNSVAMRLPKSFEVPEGIEINVVREAPMSFRFEPVTAPRKTIDVSGFWGKAPGARLVPHGDFDERPSTIAARKAAKGE